MAWIDLIKVRFGGDSSRVLIELTNNTANPTAIDTTILNAAIDDATGYFHIFVGMTPDETLNSHIIIMVQLGLAHLQQYKGRALNIVENHLNRAKELSKDLRKQQKLLPQTNSQLEPSIEKQGTRPDMDRLGPLRHLTFKDSQIQFYELSPERE